MSAQAIALPPFCDAIDNTNHTENGIHKCKMSQLAESHKRQFYATAL
jgi:hypothetical protein